MRNDIVENIRLDVTKVAIKSSISVRQNDTKTRTIHVTLTSGSSVVSLDTALMALILIEKPDGNVCYNDCVISGSEIQYTITSQTINVVGICKCQIRVIFEDNAEIISPEFNIYVYNPVVTDTGLESINEYKAANAMLNTVTEAKREAEKAANVAALSASNANDTYESVLGYKAEIDASMVDYNRQLTELLDRTIQAKEEAENEALIAEVYKEDAKAFKAEAKGYSDSSLAYRDEAEGFKLSAENAKILADSYAGDASASKSYAKSYSQDAKDEADRAKSEADRADGYRASMESSVEACANSVSEAASEAELSKSYAIGGTGRRQDEDTDNAAYYYEQVKRISGGVGGGGLVPMGTIAFADLQSQTKSTGYMFNISDAFTSDATFKDGSGKKYPPGTNVFWTEDGYWDCLVGNSVVGVKGNNEATYRTGEVNITKDNVGLGNVPNVTTNNQTPTFAQAATRANIASGETLAVILGKLQKVIADLSAVAYSGSYSNLSGVPSSFSPSSHAASGTTYGVGTTSKYGHCMTIDNLTLATHANGKVLSAHQGYVLDAKITALDNRIKALEEVSGYPFTPN